MHRKSELRELNGRKALFVDGQPFLILSLQLNCDSCFDPERIDRLLKNASHMGCNTVALPLYWRLIEPEEGRFDLSILRDMLSSANRYRLKIVLVWFGAYKNAAMHYAPDWLNEDRERFRRVQREDGTTVDSVACFNCEETLLKDARAVRRVFSYLRDQDTERAVILFQVNNETGILGDTDRCYCAACNRKFRDGRYSERFPDRAAEAFLAESDLAYQEKIAETAREIYDIPCYMNAWLQQPAPDARPGYTYPGGGPVQRVLDIYFEQKHFIDFVAPDIYTPDYHDFMRVCKTYRAEGNPLYIAEHALGTGSRAGKNLYYGIGEFSILGFDPWAIDCAYPNIMERPLCDPVHELWNDEAYEILESYLPIRNAMRPVMENMGTEKLKYWVQEDGESGVTLPFGDVRLEIGYSSAGPISGTNDFKTEGSASAGRGLAIRLDEKTFLTLGCRSFVRFCDAGGSPLEMKHSAFGHYDGDRFVSEGENLIAFGTRRNCIWMMNVGVSLTTLA